MLSILRRIEEKFRLVKGKLFLVIGLSCQEILGEHTQSDHDLAETIQSRLFLAELARLHGVDQRLEVYELRGQAVAHSALQLLFAKRDSLRVIG